MEEQEKDILFLMALAAGGAVLASGLAAFQQRLYVLPLTIAVFLIMILTFFQYKHKFVHLAENAIHNNLLHLSLQACIKMVIQ